jgi:hypothetical protein
MSSEAGRPSLPDEPLVCCNGIDGRDGSYLLPPLPLSQLADAVRGGAADWGGARELQAWLRHCGGKATRGLKEGLDPCRLAEAGWGAIFPAGPESTALREALAPLLELRRAQAGSRFRELAGDDGYRAGETKVAFLARHGAGPGPADPERLPYYLLLVGDPEVIPFSFQYQLDVQYAVGRLAFDHVEGYRRYAESVVAAETRRLARPRRVAFFAPANPDDPATGMTSAYLAAPLAERIERELPRWTVEAALGPEATRRRLGGLLRAGGEGAPALLFAACHGLGFPAGDPLQRAYQGSLVCQDWPGPTAGGIARHHYLAADDVGDDARVHGLLAFCFACFGAGTPHWDELDPARRAGCRALSPAAFLGCLPQRLLGHPAGGALAVVGHVDRAWGFSFAWAGAGPQIGTFESALRRLLAGQPVGWAMDPFNQRYAELASDLATEREALELGKTPDEALLADLWIASHDARNYAILGDPAVHLAVGDET